MSSREITEWMAFDQLEPFGAGARDIGHAIVASTVANVHRGPNEEAYKIKDFMPKQGKKEPQSVGEMIQIAGMYTAALGGKDLRDKEE